jgi:hypothetical protein
MRQGGHRAFDVECDLDMVLALADLDVRGLAGAGLFVDVGNRMSGTGSFMRATLSA